MFKVIIAGTRRFDNYDLLKSRCDKYLADKEDIIIVSGCADGADALGEKYAKERGHLIKPFQAKWDELGKMAGPIRNKAMADYADALIAFWDGNSRGTANMIEIAKKKGLPVRIVEYS
jgi:hypothetical protein